MKSGASINIKLDKFQLINLISQLEISDKIELLDILRQSTFLTRFQNLLRELKTDDLTFDEITQEVDRVRQSRYNSGKHND
ncbi:MAG: hypothetical protein KAT68_07430 [Bacteroidales bacterium]|nr:hypothetical protein [Bacteroidales bacterium]